MTSTLADQSGDAAGLQRKAETKLPKAIVGSPSLLVEGLGLFVSPLVLFVILRLSPIAPFVQQDAAMHSTYVFDPEGVLSRAASIISPSMLGDSAHVGFLVPARVMYLLFGAVPGYFVYRYCLVLVAVVPVYALLRKLYGRWAGWVGVVVIVASPVMVTIWGSDYASSAAISYLTGGQAALALSLEERRWARPLLLVAVVLFTMSLWSTPLTALVVAPAGLVYVGLRLARERSRLLSDLLVVAGVAVLTTAALALLSELLLGWWDFVELTVRTSVVQDNATIITGFHSRSPAWAPYDLYLLVPPTIIIANFVVFSRQRGTPHSVRVLGVAAAVELLVFAGIQFLGPIWVLELDLFSSYLWAVTNLLLALIVCEVMGGWAASGVRGGGAPRPRVLRRGPSLLDVRLMVPALVVLVVPLAYEVAPKVPALKWSPWGYFLGIVVIVAAVAWRVADSRSRERLHGRAFMVRKLNVFGAAVTAITSGSTLILTVAPQVPHATPPNVVAEPAASYPSALAGDYSPALEEYRVLAKMPAFIGPPSYPGEVLLMWSDPSELGQLYGPLGFVGASAVRLAGTFPSLNAGDQAEINAQHPGQILLAGLDEHGFKEAVSALNPYGARVVRKGVLGNSLYPLHLWLVDLRTFDRPATTIAPPVTVSQTTVAPSTTGLPTVLPAAGTTQLLLPRRRADDVRGVGSLHTRT